VEPVVTLFKRNGGRAWRDSDRHLQLMVELKSETGPTLRAVAEVLDHFRTTEPKGEFVIVVAGKPKVRRAQEPQEE